MTNKNGDALAEVIAAIVPARRIAIVSHRDPDPDTIGSALALGLGLEQDGRVLSFHCADPLPEMTAFLSGSDRFTKDPPPQDVDLVITVDFGDASRAALPLPDAPMVNIDHHASNRGFGIAALVDVTSAATCEMVGRVIDAMGIAWTPAMATAALMGIMTDTGSFQFPSTDPRVYERAARLRAAGADLQAITYNVYRNRRFEVLKLRGCAFSRLVREFDGLLVWSWVTRADMADVGAREEDLSGLAEQLAFSSGMRLAILFQEQDGRVKISSRTSEWPPSIDAAALMGGFGGGGHVRAAGALVPGTLDHVRTKVVSAAREAIAAALRPLART